MKLKMIIFGFLPALLGLCTFFACQPQQEAFILMDEEQQSSIYLPATASHPIRLAVQDLIHDVEKISGKRLKITDQQHEAKLLIFNLAEEDQSEQALQILAELDTLRGKWEAYVVQEEGKQLVFAGSDERAVMFAIYHFIEEYLGVDPAYYWSGLEPEKRSSLSWNHVSIRQDEPSFKFRGWFVNDEDLLTEWKNGGGVRNIDYPYYGQVVHPEVIMPVFETMLRLRMNLAIPASFVDIRNPAEEKLVEEASRRGLFVSMHHVEPMGVSAFAYQNYWKEKGEEPLFSFYSEPSKITQTWKEYAERWAKYPNVIWQVGLRGIGDRPMWMADPGVPQSDVERGAIISEAIRVQSEMINALDSSKKPLLSTTLWAEGAGLNQEGYLNFPDSMLIIFADNSPGWKWQQDFYDTPRNAANQYGVYYHHQLWGSGPHLVQAVPTQKTYEMFKEAVEHQATDYAIMNVSNVREFILGIEASAEMLYNMNAFDSENYLITWFKEHFGESGTEVQEVYQQFFDSYQIHETTGTPFLLDGQTRSFGKKVLDDIKLQLNDPQKFERLKIQQTQNSEVQTWGSKYLSDMHPESGMAPPELLPYLQEQIQDFEAINENIAEVERQLEGDTLKFFQVNLKAQHQIILSLNLWLEDVILAQLTLDKGNVQESYQHLLDANQHIAQIDEAKKLASFGEKWEHWYRGDKKMNISQVQAQTEDVLNLLMNTYQMEKSKSE